MCLVLGPVYLSTQQSFLMHLPGWAGLHVEPNNHPTVLSAPTELLHKSVVILLEQLPHRLGPRQLRDASAGLNHPDPTRLHDGR